PAAVTVRANRRVLPGAERIEPGGDRELIVLVVNPKGDVEVQRLRGPVGNQHRVFLMLVEDRELGRRLALVKPLAVVGDEGGIAVCRDIAEDLIDELVAAKKPAEAELEIVPVDELLGAIAKLLQRLAGELVGETKFLEPLLTRGWWCSVPTLW